MCKYECCTGIICTNYGIPEETLKPGIIPDSPGIPGGDSETRDNPGKPDILGRYGKRTDTHTQTKGQGAVYSYTAVLSSRCRHSLVYPGPTLPKPGLSHAGTLG